uniref:Valine--tRNA ligase n=1 Tax=Lygus hesperus TaxID=30085 RepID=A0A0A9YA91_LYGHE
MEAALVHLHKATTEAEKELDKIRDKLHRIEAILTKNMSFLEVEERLCTLKGDLAKVREETDHVTQELTKNDAELSVKFREAEVAFENLVAAVSGSDRAPA